MRYPTISIRFNRRKVATATRKAIVEVLVSFSQKKMYFPTGVRLSLGQWKGGRVVRHPEAAALNRQIDDILSIVRDKTAALFREGRFSLDELKAQMRQKCESGEAPVQWIRERIKARNDITESTRKQHLSMTDDLERCGLFKTWDDFTLSKIEEWERHIRTHVRAQSSVYGYHKRLKPYINDAVKHGMLPSSPYLNFRVSRGEKDTVPYLTDEERDRIDALELERGGVLDKVRDCFIFSCYTGLAYSDLKALSRDMIVENGGHFYIVGNRKKNGSKYIAPLLQRAIEILEKWDYQMPVISNVKYNYFLKFLAPPAKISKRLTTHVARHTFATWLLHRGVPLHIVSRSLGHADIKSTQIYAKTLDSDVKDALSGLE